VAAIYQLEKNIFTEADFEQMNWHDCHIHSFSFNDNYELLMDIDYMFEWVHPKKEADTTSFGLLPVR
jgi:hypothetical protein